MSKLQHTLILFSLFLILSCSSKAKNPPDQKTKQDTVIDSSTPSTKELEEIKVSLKKAENLVINPNPITASPANPPNPTRKAGPISADKSLGWLKNGNLRFLNGKLRKDGTSSSDREKLINSESPHAIIFTDSESRIPPEIIFDQKLGEIYVVRNTGMNVDSSVVASCELAIQNLGTNLLVILSPIQTSTPAARKNQENILKTLLEKSPMIKKGLDSRAIKVIMAQYHLSTGQIDWIEDIK